MIVMTNALGGLERSLRRLGEMSTLGNIQSVGHCRGKQGRTTRRKEGTIDRLSRLLNSERRWIFTLAVAVVSKLSNIPELHGAVQASRCENASVWMKAVVERTIEQMKSEMMK